MASVLIIVASPFGLYGRCLSNVEFVASRAASGAIYLSENFPFVDHRNRNRFTVVDKPAQ